MPLSLLIVDDSPVARALLKGRLKAKFGAEFFQISEAADGVAALQALRSQWFDLVLLDLTMGGMDGYQVLEQMREEQMEVLVYVVTADVQPQAEERARALGAAGLFHKPFDVKHLEAALSQRGWV